MRRLALVVTFTWVSFGAYALCYALLRGSHQLVHSALWTSEEGLNGHHVHGMLATHEALLGAFSPLVWFETGVHDIVE